MQSAVGTVKSGNKLRNGTALIKVQTYAQAISALAMWTGIKVPIKVIGLVA
jgi:hypothetical protein